MGAPQVAHDLGQLLRVLLDRANLIAAVEQLLVRLGACLTPLDNLLHWPIGKLAAAERLTH